MAIQWSGTSGRMQVGIDVRTSAISAGTTSATVWVDYWVRSMNWAYGDNQRLTSRGSGQGQAWDYYMSSPNGSITEKFIGTVTLAGQGLSYAGGPTYRFGATVSGAYDGSSPSLDISWTLPKRVAEVPTAPTTSISNVTATGARVTVGASDPRGSAITNYYAWVATDSSFTNVVDSATGGSFNATGLAPGTRYYARSRSRNGVGYSAYSSTRSFVTSATVPSAPRTPTVSGISVGSATLSWLVPTTDGGSDIDEYQVQYAKNSAFTSGAVAFIDESSPAALSNLDAGTQYWVRVRAINGVGNSPWSSVITFTTVQGTPTITSPAAGAQRVDGRFDFSLALQGAKSDTTITVEASRNSDFSGSPITRTVNASSAQVSGTNYRVQTTASGFYLGDGTWYVRARAATPSSSYTSPWSTTVSFTQFHQPAASLTGPTNGSVALYVDPVNFTWNFADSASGNPNEAQSAYRIVVENTVTNEVVFDSGKVASSAASHALSIASALKGVQLRWRVMVWDAADTASAWTGYSLFTLSDPPVVQIVTPATGLDLDNGSPLISWSFSAPSGGTQVSAVVTITDSATGEEVWRDDVLGATFSTQPPGVVLLNSRTYLLTLVVTDSNGLSTTTSENYSVSYSAPDPIPYEIDSVSAEQVGYILVDWSQAVADSQFIAWRVYRRLLEVDTWTLVATIPGQSTRQYRDYMVTSGEIYLYSVTQMAYRFGADLESPVGYRQVSTAGGATENIPEIRTYDVEISQYWLINPDQPNLSFAIPGVIADPVSEEYESETYSIAGRGRHVDYGDRLGYKGTLTVQVLQTERKSALRKQVRDLRDSRDTYWLRTPFGALFPVAIGTVGWDPRAGTGMAEMGEMTIPYEEVG